MKRVFAKLFLSMIGFQLIVNPVGKLEWITSKSIFNYNKLEFGFVTFNQFYVNTLFTK